MATLLTNSKMHPALAARVEASVAGRRRQDPAAVGRGRRVLRAAVRVGLVVGISWLGISVVVSKRREARELEATRASLLAKLHAVKSTWSADDMLAKTRAEEWLGRLSGAYAGDFVAPELRAEGAMATLLAAPTMYARGTTDQLSSDVTRGEAVAASHKDGFAVCLIDPPAWRAEKAVLAKAKGAYSTAAHVEERTPTMRRLADIGPALAVLGPDWEAQVHAAKDERTLELLRTELERKLTERAHAAAKARVLVAVLDDPGAGPADIDGERPHDVRVALVDLRAGRPLFRLKRKVDPNAWSADLRTQYSSGLDSCLLALDVIEAAKTAK